MAAESDSRKHAEVYDDAEVDDVSEPDSEDDSRPPPPPRPRASAPPEPTPDRFKLFGRTQPIHAVLGGGKAADIILWRDLNMSAGVLGISTAIWVFFDLFKYHLLTYICHGLALILAMLFLWSNASAYVNKSTPPLPKVSIPEDVIVNIALFMQYEINRAFTALREIATGQDVKKFFMVIAGLWLLSVVGQSCSLLALFYTTVVILLTVPVLYEKYEVQVDTYGEKAMIEMKRHYGTFDAQVLSKIPIDTLKVKKN